MPDQQGRILGRYALYNAIAAGGMATVHLGRLMGAVGFSRTVAIKRLHAQFAADPEFVSMFVDEARLAARIRHPNVVPTLDVVQTDGELFLVMEYVPGESISRIAKVLRERMQVIPVRIMSSIMASALHGLHAAHEAKDERGHPLGIVHRDVSPQNVLLGADGVTRVLDFGVAKAVGRIQTTREGQIKGKLSYMPPEQLRGSGVTRQTDIYAAGVMLWEIATGERLFSGENEGVIVGKVLEMKVERPSRLVLRNRHLGHTEEDLRYLEALDSTILQAVSRDANQRFETAREMALEIERRCPPATASDCGDWLESIAHDVLVSRAAMVAEIESSGSMVLDGHDPHVTRLLHGGGPTPSMAVAEQPAPSTAHSSTVLATVGAPPFAGYPTSIHEGPPITSPSSMSVASGSLYPQAPGEPNARRAAGITAIVGLVLSGLVLGGAVYFKQVREAQQRQFDIPPPAEAATQPGVTTGVATAPTPPPVEADPMTPPAPPTTLAVTPTGTPISPPPPAPAPNKGTPRRQPSPPPKPPSSSQGDDCVYFDAQGVKKYRQHCLGK